MSTIHKGFERNSIPSADTALRIAKSLNVSLEYLLDMTETSNTTAIDGPDIQQAIRMYRKYNTMLQQLEFLSQKECGVISQLIDTFADFHQRAE